MWVLTEQGEIVNMHHMRNIGVNTQVKPGFWAVVAIYAKHAKGQDENDGVILQTFKLQESAEGFMEKLHQELIHGRQFEHHELIQ